MEITLWYIHGKELDVIIFIVLIVTWHSYQNTIKGAAPRLNFWNAVPFFDYGEAIIDSQNFSLTLIREIEKVQKLKTAQNRALTAGKRKYGTHPKGERKAMQNEPFLV